MASTSQAGNGNIATKPQSRGHRCIEVWKIPNEVRMLSKERRFEALMKIAKREDTGPFPPNSLTSYASISMVEEAVVILSLFVVLGGPLVWICSMVALLLFGTWTQLVVAILVSLVLAYHPMPSREFSNKHVVNHWLTLCLYKYFSYRLVWSGDSHEKTHQAQPWIAASPPHGVMPFANVLSIPTLNGVSGIDFVGAPASVVMHTPFLRWLTLFSSVPVSGKSICTAIDEGLCVGIVPDGIAGIFRQNPHKEVVALKHRKGLARLALRHGINILPAYSFGNTAVFSSWWDPYGILEHMSRKSQASLFFYWGRLYLPIPMRCRITLVFGDPIIVDKVDGDPTQQQIDALQGLF